jgi:hypothetical protein
MREMFQNHLGEQMGAQKSVVSNLRTDWMTGRSRDEEDDGAAWHPSEPRPGRPGRPANPRLILFPFTFPFFLIFH